MSGKRGDGLSVTPYRYRGIRWREDTGWELRCDSCVAKHSGTEVYWPLEPVGEFWNPRDGLARCRACHLAADRLAHRKARASLAPERRKARDRARYLANRDLFLLKQRERDKRRREERAA